MDIMFKYNNKIITTPNLEKKLKRMKISIEDIEIIENKEKPSNDGIEDYMLDKKEVKVKVGNIYKIFFIKESDNIDKVFKKYYPNVNDYEIVI